MTKPLSETAVANGDLLRLIGDGVAPDEAGRRLGRSGGSNFKRTLDRLADAGLLEAEGHALTEAGRRARLGLDVAEGLIAVDTDLVAVRHADLAPHPHNPRTTVDAETIDSLAATMAGQGGLLQRMVVTEPKPSANGVRHILIGERRWRAWGLLIERGEWPADTVLTVRARPDRPGLIEELSLIENGQRVDLTKLERARAYLRLATSRNLQPPAIAAMTGDHLRVVQEGLKVVREAAPDDLAAHEADPKAFTWERLRDSVKEARPKPSLDVDPDAALALVELCHAIAARGDGDPAAGGMTRIRQPGAGGVWARLRDRGLIEPVFVGDGKMRARPIAHALGPWLAEIGFAADPDAALEKARADAFGALQAAAAPRGLYLTDWLNLDPEPAPEAAPPPEEPEADAATVEPTPERDGVALYQQLAADLVAGLQLKPHAALALIELAHKLAASPVATGRGFNGVEVGKYAVDPVAHQLVLDRLIGFLPGPKTHFLAYLTPRGFAWVAKACPDGIDQATLDAARHVAAVKPAEGYATAWLNLAEAPAAEAPPPRRDAAEGSRPAPTDDFARQVREAVATPPAEPDPAAAEAELILGQVRDLTAPTPQLLRQLFEACGVALPLSAGDNRTDPGDLFMADSYPIGTTQLRQGLHDGLAEARARLIALAVNAACGVEADG